MKVIYDESAIKLIKLFGQNLQRIRLYKNISIKKLSKKSGIRENYLKKIEKGEALGITTSQLFVLANALSVHPSVLVKEKPEPSEL